MADSQSLLQQGLAASAGADLALAGAQVQETLPVLAALLLKPRFFIGTQGKS